MKKPKIQRTYVLELALEAAIEDSKLLPRGNEEYEQTKASAREILSQAWSDLQPRRRGGKSLGDLPTRQLFGSSYLGLNREVKLRVLLHDEFPEMEKLSGLHQYTRIEVERIFELHDILCPLALQLFCSAAERQRAELASAAEKTHPAPLTCTA